MSYWKTKIFKTKEEMQRFIDIRKNRIEYQEIFVNNEYGIEYRELTVIHFE